MTPVFRVWLLGGWGAYPDESSFFRFMAAALGPSVDDLPLSSKVLPTKSPKNRGVATL